MARFDADDATRVVLQFVYEYFRRVDNLRYDEGVFEALWFDFIAEVQDPDWVSRAVANVRNLKSENRRIDFGDGVTISARNFEELTSLGFSSAVLERLSEDWAGFGASSFVLLAEQTVRKQPGNLILLDAASPWTKAIRAVGALRLAAPGDLSIGPMWVVRSARFNLIGSFSEGGISIPAIGSEYVWTEDVDRLYRSLYWQLAQLERIGYDASPGNLELALRSFMATYDRWPRHRDSQLLDSITALEALLGSRTEIAFKLAFRVAALLAASEKQRGTLLKLMKDFYDTRSALVHGAHLKKKHEGRLARVDELRSMVRTVVRSFVAFATNPPHDYGKSFFEQQLDAALVDASEREKLRAALGLDRN